MADQSVTVEFGARTDEIDKGSAAVKSKLQDLQNQTDSMASGFGAFGDAVSSSFDKGESAISSFNDAVKSVNDNIQKGGATVNTGWMKFLLGAGAGAAVAGVVSAFHTLGQEFIKMDQTARESTLSLQRFQELQYALNQSGAGTDKIVSGLQEASKKWNDLNHDAGETGKLLDANHVKWKDQTGQIISFNEYINQSSRLIANAKTELDRFKIGEILGFSREWVRVLQGGPAALQKLSEEANKGGAVIKTELVEQAVEFQKRWNQSSLDWSIKFKAIMVDLLPYIDKFINFMLDGLKSWVTYLKSAVTPALVEAISPAEHAAIRARNAVSTVVGQFNEAVSSGDRFKETFSAFDAGIPTISSQLSVMVGQMSKMPPYWQSAVTDIKKAGDMMKELGREEFFPAKGTVIPGKDDKFDVAKLRELQEELDKVREKYQQQKVIEQTAVDTFKETEGQKVAHLKAVLAERLTATTAVFQKELALAGDSAERRAAIERSFNKEKAAIELEGLKLTEDMLKKRTQDWESSLSGITGAFNSQLRGLLAGTTTWAQAMKNIAADLVIKMIEEFEKLAIVKPLSGMLASMMAAPAELFTGLIKAIAGMFGPLMAGFTSFFAPTQGPAAPAEGAAAAAATVAAATAAVGAFEYGTDYVPKTGMALVHQGERIIPASQNVMGGAGVPMAAVTFNVQALDSSGVQAFFGRYGPQIAKMLAAHMNQNPSYGT